MGARVSQVNEGPPLPLPHPDGRVVTVGVESGRRRDRRGCGVRVGQRRMVLGGR
jgi:hypothetical protein